MNQHIVEQDWRQLVLSTWPAVTASDLLEGSDGVWCAEGLSPPNDDEAVALAAVGRLIRYGQSVAIHLPISLEATIPRLAFYLHRLRLDAAQGLVRSPWLNRVEMSQRVDLLVFGRPRGMLRDFVSSMVMRPAIVNASTPPELAGFQRTLLIDGHGDLLSTLEMLSNCSRPFAIVLDTTHRGCADNAVSLIKALPSLFAKVPVIAVGYTGQALEGFENLHTWKVRLGDAVALSSRRRPMVARSVDVLAARDPVMNDFVKRLSFLLWNLKRLAEETDGRTPELAALAMVERVLRCINVPLAVHEKETIRYLRGGRFAVRSLESWLDIASRLRARRGDVQALKDEILLLIQNNLRYLRDATPGRSELLLQLGYKAVRERRSMSILVGNRRDALILQRWMEESLGPDAIGVVAVYAMDGATALPPDYADYVVYAEPLYPSRLHWLGLVAKYKQVLCHPFEQERVCQQIDRWWRANALTSALAGDKYRLWSLNWNLNKPLQDQLVEDDLSPKSFAVYEECPFGGHYPQPLRVAQLEVSRRYDDWLQALLAEPARDEINVAEQVEGNADREVAILHLAGHSEPVRLPADLQIMRFKGDTFSVGPVRELVAGDNLVLLRSSEDRVATQRELFDIFVQDNYGLQQVLRLAEKWQEYVEHGVSKLGTVAQLTRYLKGRKVDITPGAVHHWHAGRVIGPDNPSAIYILAELAQEPNAEAMAKMVENAIHVVRNEHRKIGTDLRKAIALTRSRDVSAVQIGSRRFSREVFDAMVEVCRVIEIDRPTQSSAAFRSLRSLKDVAREFASRHGDKLVLTKACERSMERSAFTDLDSFELILHALVEGFYPMYAGKSVSLKEVEERLAAIPASYAGRMSEVTKGRFESDYVRLYDGQKVDISRHIKLGKSFDPKHTLRLHFHWDAKATKIVVHHAGVHLPTLSS
ncbi:DISARM anti-phage system protein DrmE domain-containing protein [Burkholderia gladioli]|uniref:DISARM anti-phage system protein DrmE domain-containing protein n=1 Tax=Burkholderia gladioli TaxID=28095 RepID=UPI001640E8BB|nr:hypothetical protein [Burkholderia gladioli]MDN7813899.1 hypothetical protein [Burkholderia gladioli]